MCIHNLRTDFMNSSSGGSWTYVGYNSTSLSGPFTVNASTPPAALSGIVPLALVGDDPAIDWAAADKGYYFFTYDLGVCGNSVTLLVHNKEECFNASTTISVHNQMGPIDLKLLAFDGCGSGRPTGYWKYDTLNYPGAFDPINGIVYPSLMDVGASEDYSFVIAKDCSDCKATITVNIVTCGINDQCHYYTDFSETMTQADLDAVEIQYFKVGGINQLSSPIVGLGPKNVIDFGGSPYLTNLVDTLNNIGLPCFTFNYSTVLAGTETRQKFMRICYPKGAQWEFKIYVPFGGSDSWWIYSLTSGISFSYDDVTYVNMTTDSVYNILAGTTTGIESCSVVSSCD